MPSYSDWYCFNILLSCISSLYYCIVLWMFVYLFVCLFCFKICLSDFSACSFAIFTCFKFILLYMYLAIGNSIADLLNKTLNLKTFLANWGQSSDQSNRNKQCLYKRSLDLHCFNLSNWSHFNKKKQQGFDLSHY